MSASSCFVRDVGCPVLTLHKKAGLNSFKWEVMALVPIAIALCFRLLAGDVDGRQQISLALRACG